MWNNGFLIQIFHIILTSSWHMGMTPHGFSICTLSRYAIIQYSCSLRTSIFAFIVIDSWLQVGLRCHMMRHRSSSIFSHVWLPSVIQSYIWNLVSYVSWILKGISCQVTYPRVTHPMLSPCVLIIKWAFFLPFLVLDLEPWVLGPLVSYFFTLALRLKSHLLVFS